MADRRRCDNCNRRLGNESRGIIYGSVTWYFCGDRRECRRAWNNSIEQGRVEPPARADDVSTEAFGAALIGFDYVELPWWLRILPDPWLDGLRHEVAVKVGGIVERHLYLKNTGLDHE